MVLVVHEGPVSSSASLLLPWLAPTHAHALGVHLGDGHSLPSKRPVYKALPVHFGSAQLRGDSLRGASPT